MAYDFTKTIYWRRDKVHAHNRLVVDGEYSSLKWYIAHWLVPDISAFTTTNICR